MSVLISRAFAAVDNKVGPLAAKRQDGTCSHSRGGVLPTSDCQQTRKRSLSRRRRSLCDKDPGKTVAIVEEQHKP